jgi:hypothetical protein
MAAKKKATPKSKKKNVKSVKDLTIHFMPYSEIAKEDAIGRVKKIMGMVLDGKIIILQGMLNPEEEAKLIENSMMMIGNVKDFQGIEVASISSQNDTGGLFDRIRRNIARILVGEQDAITIIGPATVVKDIKKDPRKMEMMLQRR